MLTALFATVLLGMVALEGYVEARAGAGRSAGSRGSRSYQTPARPSQPTQPRREATPPSQQPSPVAPQTGGFMRGLAGGLLGGFLGSMLFSGLAQAGWGGMGGSGLGFIEILLLAGLGYWIYRRIRRPALATGYNTMPYQNTDYPSAYNNRPFPESQVVEEPDLSSIRILDSAFDPGRFVKSAQDIFFKVQAAWGRQDGAALAALCTPELVGSWNDELAQLRARGQSNHIENTALRTTEITEAWTEQGQDYITVRIEASLLDYTVDEKSGLVITGSKAEPIEFDEYWTFTRSVGPNPWKLSAVQQP